MDSLALHVHQTQHGPDSASRVQSCAHSKLQCLGTRHVFRKTTMVRITIKHTGDLSKYGTIHMVGRPPTKLTYWVTVFCALLACWLPEDHVQDQNYEMLLSTSPVHIVVLRCSHFPSYGVLRCSHFPRVYFPSYGMHNFYCWFWLRSLVRSQVVCSFIFFAPFFLDSWGWYMNTSRAQLLKKLHIAHSGSLFFTCGYGRGWAGQMKCSNMAINSKRGKPWPLWTTTRRCIVKYIIHNGLHVLLVPQLTERCWSHLGAQ